MKENSIKEAHPDCNIYSIHVGRIIYPVRVVHLRPCYESTADFQDWCLENSKHEFAVEYEFISSVRNINAYFVDEEDAMQFYLKFA